jgi:hypothetical protein
MLLRKLAMLAGSAGLLARLGRSLAAIAAVATTTTVASSDVLARGLVHPAIFKTIQAPGNPGVQSGGPAGGHIAHCCPPGFSGGTAPGGNAPGSASGGTPGGYTGGNPPVVVKPSHVTP